MKNFKIISSYAFRHVVECLTCKKRFEEDDARVVADRVKCPGCERSRNKALIESHGFDMKYGFRKEPTKKFKK